MADVDAKSAEQRLLRPPKRKKKRFGNVKRPPRKKKPNRNNCNNCNNKFRSVLLAPEFRVEEELSDADAQDSTRLW